MRPKDLNDLRRKLRRQCQKRGLELREIKPRRGSHASWVILDPDESVIYRVVIPIDRKEISPGVQRDMLKRATEKVRCEEGTFVRVLANKDGIEVELKISLRDCRKWIAKTLRSLCE